ncbi:hypothetical protein [Mycobacteroides abscessus]|nr:hypothetical protein [Mycobacteroides abscessus]
MGDKRIGMSLGGISCMHRVDSSKLEGVTGPREVERGGEDN